MFKAYRNFQLTQLNWIRKHPVQYIALNAILIVAFVGYSEYQERKLRKEFENDTEQLIGN